MSQCSPPYPCPWGISAFLCLNQGQDVKPAQSKNTKAIAALFLLVLLFRHVGPDCSAARKRRRRRWSFPLCPQSSRFSLNCLTTVCQPLSLRRGSSFSGSHMRTQKQNISAEVLYEDTSCSSLCCLPCPLMYRTVTEQPFLMQSCYISSPTPRNFPDLFSQDEENHQVSHVSCSGHTCSNWLQLNFEVYCFTRLLEDYGRLLKHLHQSLIQSSTIASNIITFHLGYKSFKGCIS